MIDMSSRRKPLTCVAESAQDSDLRGGQIGVEDQLWRTVADTIC